MSKGSLNTHAKFFSGSNMSFENLLLPCHTWFMMAFLNGDWSRFEFA